MATKSARVDPLAGLANQSADPAALDWMKSAARNPAVKLTPAEKRADRAATAKAKRAGQDAERVRVKYDLPPALKTAIEQYADRREVSTSASQLAAFLLSFGLHELSNGNAALRGHLRDGLSPARTMRFASNLSLPPEWLPAETP